MDIQISVLIPTYNRTKYLPLAIESLNNQTLPKSQFEIIIVDNASTDDTKEVVEQARKNAPNLHYQFESKQGLNFARNTGIAHSKGKYVAFLDDDAIACNDWLQRIISAFEMDSSIGALGGRVIPIWEIEKPDWVTSNMERPLSVLNISPSPIYISTSQYLVGANFAFRKEELVKLGGFKDGLDRSGTNLISNGDVHVIKLFSKAGYKVYYDPEISVRHVVPANRLTKDWFYKRYYWQGYSDILQEDKSIFPFILLSSTLKLILKQLSLKKSVRFESRLLLLYNLGYLKGYIQK